MRLYHFTAERFLPSIQKQGLTRGVMLKSLNPLAFIHGRQWLTKNPSFDQEWAVGTGALPYKRNEVRLTIEIPEALAENVKPWSQMRFLVPEVAGDLSMFGDPENWMIYIGDVRPHWIVEIDRNAGYILPTEKDWMEATS